MAVTRSGVRISTQSNFSTYTDTLVSGQQGTVSVAGLEPATKYYAKGLAEADGTVYASYNTIDFKTLDYMWFKNTTNGYVSLTIARTGGAISVALDYSYDGVTWGTADLGSVNTSTVIIPAGGYLFLKGSNKALYDASANSGVRFSANGILYAGGNVLTLLYDKDVSEVIPEYGLYGVFNGMSNLKSCPDFSKVKGVEDYGLTGCFQDCTGIIQGPDLSSAILGAGDYAFMRAFKGCTSLERGIQLPIITTSRVNMCTEMYMDCTAMRAAGVKEIMDDTASDCFERMFYGCSSLDEVSIGLQSYTAANHTDWLYGVAATGTLWAPSGLSIPVGNNGVPSGWSVRS